MAKDLEVLNYINNSMQELALKIERAQKANKTEEVKRLKSLILKMQEKFAEELA
jgi:hypothetical protein